MGSSMTKESHFYDYSSPRNRRKRNSDPSSNHYSKEYAQYWQAEQKAKAEKNGRNWTVDKSQYPLYDQSNRYHLAQRNSNSSQYGASFSPKEKYANNFSVTPSTCGQKK